jgi:tetratricopeptide (TPR) repeat protein
MHPPSRHSPVEWERWRIWALGVLLLASVAIIYWPVLEYGFVAWDDDLHVYDNPRFIPVTWDSIAAFWLAPYEHLYMPLTYTVWGALVWIANATQPGPLTANLFHRLNLLLHLGSSLIVYRLGLLWLSGAAPSRQHALATALGAMVFALHPLQVEAVAWVSGLKDTLSGFFTLLAVWQYLAFAQCPNGKRCWHHYVLASSAFACALFAKPAAVITPIIVALLMAHRGRPRPRYHRQTLGGWAVVAVVWGVWTKLQQPDTALAFIPTWGERLVVAIDALAFYARQVACPLWLGPDYGRTPQVVIAQGWPLMSAGLVVVGSLGLWWTRHQWGRGGTAVAVFIVGVLPVLGLIPFLFQAHSTVADRYTYVAMLGVALGVGWLGQQGGRFCTSLVVVTMVVGGFFGWCSGQQVQVWRDTQTLFTHALQVNPRSAVAHNNLGLALANQQRLPEAITHYKQALQFRATMPEAYYNLGDALAARGELDRAVAHYTMALRLKPGWPEAYNNLATALSRQGKLDEAIAHYTEALRLKPDWALPYNNLGEAMVKQGRATEAIGALAKAAHLQPILPEAPYNLAGVLWQQGYRSEAMVAYREALRRRPHWPQAANHLASLLMTQEPLTEQDLAEAITLAEFACQATDFRHPAPLRTLAAAYHAAGRGPEAVRLAQTALRHVNAVHDPGLFAKIQAQIEEYQAVWQPQTLPIAKESQ